MQKIANMNVALRALAVERDKDLEQVQLKFMTKQEELVIIVNELKKKLNGLNRGIDCELQVRDTIND